MSKSKKVVVTTRSKTAEKKAAPTVSKRKKTVTKGSSTGYGHPLIFNKTNYLYMLAGIGLIGLGLLLMQGGAMPAPDVWDESLIYSPRRIILAPAVILLGLMVEIYAIFKKTGDDTVSDTEV